MGLFLGKYAIKIQCGNGDVGLFMSVDKKYGVIYLTESRETAEKFITQNAAKEYYYKICEMPVLNLDGEEDYIADAWMVKFN